MSHKQQKDFCNQIKQLFPDYFINKDVLDLGSLDINGNNRYLFTECRYTGVDVGPGPNVDIVYHAHKVQGSYDVVISTEMLEHDQYYVQTLKHIVECLLKPNGLFFFTCATTGRQPHGLKEQSPDDSPYTNDWYKTLTMEDVNEAIDLEKYFIKHEFIINTDHHDLYFWGIKRG
jgi:hypothetical protein